MIKYKIGNILGATENIICHQVNLNKCFGGGLALQIATKYPNVEKAYRTFAESKLGNVQLVHISQNRYIANCFTQRENFDTDYNSVNKVFRWLLQQCKDNKLSICVPYKYGCGIANGNWGIVEKIFIELSEEYNVPITIYKLKNEN